MSKASDRYHDIRQYHDEDNSDAWRLVLLLKSENDELKRCIQYLCKSNLEISKICDVENCKYCFITEALIK